MEYRTVTLQFSDNPEDMPPDDLGFLLAQLNELSKLHKAVQSLVLARLQKKESVPGWTLKPGRRSRVWKSEDAAVKAMSAQGINDPYKRDLKSVADAEKETGVGEKDTGYKLGEAWEWKPGNLSLASAPISATTATKTSPYGF